MKNRTKWIILGLVLVLLTVATIDFVAQMNTPPVSLAPANPNFPEF